MAQIHTLKKNGESIYPLTHMKGVVDDNGNTMDVLLAEAEKRVLRNLYIAAGAEYNDTDQVIKKTAFWGEEVDHLPKHYYLNGLGDITEEQMLNIYEYKDVMYWIMAGVNCARLFQDITSPRTLFAPKNPRYALNQSVAGWTYLFVNNIEVVKFWHANTWRSVGNTSILNEDAFYNNHGLKVVDTFKQGNLVHIKAPKLTHIRAILTKSFSVNQSSLITKDSVLYMINKFDVPSSNATSNTPYTITLHPDVYAKCINGGEWYEEINTALTAKNEALSAKNYSLNLVSD